MEDKCRQRARSSRSVSARKQGNWTKLKGVRVRLRPRRLQTKIDPTGDQAWLARQPKSSCVTVRSWSPVRKQSYHSLFWHRGKVGLPLEGEAKQPSSHHSHCGTICLLSEVEANESAFAVSLRRPYIRLRWFKQLALFRTRLSLSCFLRQLRLHDGREVCLQALVLARRYRSS